MKGAFERAARAHAASRASAGTRSLYLAELERWLAWCLVHHVEPARPTLRAATQFRDELSARLAQLTVRRILASLSSMYQAAMDQEKPLATWNPFKSLPRPPADAYTRTEAISDLSARRILAATEKDHSLVALRDRAILRLLYDTGLRRASVAGIRSRNVFVRQDGGEKQIVLRAVVKGGKEREKILPPICAAALDDWMQKSMGISLYEEQRDVPDGCVFPAKHSRQQPITPSALNKIVDKRARAAGLKGVHPHQFRTAFATSALDADSALHEVQAAMDHEDPKTTLRYDRSVRGGAVATAVAERRREREERERKDEDQKT